MYTICTPSALRTAYYQWDKAGNQKGMTANTSGAPLGHASTSHSIASIPTAPWTAVELDSADPSIIVREFEMPYDPSEKNHAARSGGAAAPVSAAVAASISFPSLNKEGDVSGQDAQSSAIPPPKWHYRYRFNKRGRCVVETNSAEGAYWTSLFAHGTATHEGEPKIKIQTTETPLQTKKGIQREIVVFFKKGSERPAVVDDTADPPSAADVGAVDLNCYHVGYPIDMGDIEDILVCGIGKEDEGPSGTITTINCPLHNRIFDVSTGDLIRMDYSGAFADCLLEDSSDTLLKVTKGKWKGGVVQRDACRQRIHTVTLQQGTGRIVIKDSYFPSDATSKTQEYTSDKYNVLGDTSVRSVKGS